MLFLAVRALQNERRLFGLFLDLDDELGFSAIAALVLPQVPPLAERERPGRRGLERFHLVHVVAFAVRAIGVHCFRDFHVKSLNQQLFKNPVGGIERKP